MAVGIDHVSRLPSGRRCLRRLDLGEELAEVTDPGATA
jgi:hypothetical protein